MGFKLKIVYSFIIFSFGGFAAQLGEKKTDNYSGPHLPIFKSDKYFNESVSQDDYYNDWYFKSKVQPEFFDLQKYMQGEFLVGHYCPDEIYNEYSDHYRYLIRILAISYLHNSIQEYEYSAIQMGDTKICKPKWAEIFKNCQAQSPDMKDFIKYIKYVLPNIKQVIVPFEQTKKKVIQNWISDYKKGSDLNLTQQRLSLYCQKNKCQNLDKISLQKYLKAICSEDVVAVKQICSEKDQLFGISQAAEVYPLIIRSNALRVVAPPKFQTGCLRRFIQSNKENELDYRPLKYVFAHLYSKYRSTDAPYEQGRIFIAGALKEFQQKGIDDLFVEKPNVIVKNDKNTTKASNGVKPTIAQIELPKYKPEKKKPRKKKPVIKKKVEKQYSAFYAAADFRRRNNLDKIDLDMDKFKYDFVFTLDQRKKYMPVIKKFSSRSSLEKMKRIDGLGLAKAPIPLKFLKLLIDQEMHQDIYNITLVLGDRFHVLNDIDGVKGSELVQLKNDQSTGFKWMLSILKQ